MAGLSHCSQRGNGKGHIFSLAGMKTLVAISGGHRVEQISPQQLLKKIYSALGKGFFFIHIYGELSRAISRGWANNCVYPIGVGSNVVLTTRRCRESYADQRWETRFSFDDIKIKLHGTLAIFLSWQSFFCKVTFNIWTKDQLNYNPFKRVSITFQNNMVNFNGKYIGKKWKVLRENMLER